MNETIVVLGAGGHAKVVIDTIENNTLSICGLTDANYVTINECMGYPVLGNDGELDYLYKKGITYAAMGIGHVGYPKVRNEVYQHAKQIGFEFPTLVHPSAAVSRTSVIGEGSLCAAQAVINPEAHIGKLCIVNSSAVVEHEVVLGDGVHIAPGTVILGAASIGDNSFIGAGSVILQGIHIGKNCIVGAGSIVLHDVEDNCVVVGNPGKVIKRR